MIAIVECHAVRALGRSRFDIGDAAHAEHRGELVAQPAAVDRGGADLGRDESVRCRAPPDRRP